MEQSNASPAYLSHSSSDHGDLGLMEDETDEERSNGRMIMEVGAVGRFVCAADDDAWHQISRAQLARGSAQRLNFSTAPRGTASGQEPEHILRL